MTQPNLTPDQSRRLLNILSSLSPENLFCDGERPAQAARRIERSLKAQWKAIEKEVGRPISDGEVWATLASR